MSVSHMGVQIHQSALQVDEGGKLTCYHLEVVVDMPPAKVQSLPPDAVIVQFTHMQAPNAAAPDQAAQGGHLAPGEPPETFLELLVSGQVRVQSHLSTYVSKESVHCIESMKDGGAHII